MNSVSKLSIRGVAKGSVFLLAVPLLGALPIWAQSGRYLYVLNCDARITKVDTVLNRQVSSSEPPRGKFKTPVLPSLAADQAIDGCLMNYLVFEAKASMFYTIVPDQIKLKADGTKDYRLVAFSVPSLTPLKAWPAGSNLAEPPHVEPTNEKGEAGQPRIVPAADWSQHTDLDLSTFAPEKEQIRNQILEESGTKALLRLFTPNPEDLVLAIADRKEQSVAKLSDLVSTTARNAHLSPGADAVWVEGTDKSGRKTGTAVLFDGFTGRILRKFADPNIKAMSFLAISPSGKAIYHSGDKYAFVNLGRKFNGGRVSHLMNADDYPPLFFASK